MRLIKMLGLFYLLHNMIYKNSFRAYIIFINGMIYHGYATKENIYKPTACYLRYYDMYGNILLSLYTYYITPEVYLYGLFGLTNFLFLYYLALTEKYNKHLSMEFFDTMHVLAVQYPLFLGLDKSLLLLEN